MTPKQEAFVREYLIDLNATQAAIRAGYDFAKQANGFYVYLLLSGQEIIYVGKGKGQRVKQHGRDCGKPHTSNQVKAARIRAALQAGVFSEVIFAAELGEAEALKIEKRLIEAFKSAGIANITSGNVHPLESQMARAEANLQALVPFEQWVRIVPQYGVDFIVRRGQTLREFYEWFAASLADTRAAIAADLKLINENQNG